MWFFFSLAAALASEAPACPEGDARALLLDAAERAEAAWTQGEGAAFSEAADALEALLPCVRASLSAEDAGTLHRARALVAFVGGDAEGARRALVAARLLDPSWAPPADVVPPGHPLWALYDAAAPEDDAPIVRFLARPSHGWSVDGTRFPLPDRETRGRAPDDGLPAERAFVLQIFGAEGVPTWTGYHLSTATVPLGALELGPDPDVLRAKRRKQARIWGSVVGGSLLVAGGTTFGLGWSARSQLDAGQVPLPDVEARAAAANTLGGVSYGLAGAGALLTTLAWSVPW